VSADVQSPVFVGRRDEMASLALLLERAQQGQPAFALIAGSAQAPRRTPASRDDCAFLVERFQRPSRKNLRADGRPASGIRDRGRCA
jgi:hypothetical protein